MEVVEGIRVVDEGEVVTAGGVTAGIDLGLHLVSRFFGDELAATVASVMEYRARRAPPLHLGGDWLGRSGLRQPGG